MSVLIDKLFCKTVDREQPCNMGASAREGGGRGRRRAGPLREQCVHRSLCLAHIFLPPRPPLPPLEGGPALGGHSAPPIPACLLGKSSSIGHVTTSITVPHSIGILVKDAPITRLELEESKAVELLDQVTLVNVWMLPCHTRCTRSMFPVMCMGACSSKPHSYASLHAHAHMYLMCTYKVRVLRTIRLRAIGCLALFRLQMRVARSSMANWSRCTTQTQHP